MFSHVFSLNVVFPRGMDPYTLSELWPNSMDLNVRCELHTMKNVIEIEKISSTAQ